MTALRPAIRGVRQLEDDDLPGMTRLLDSGPVVNAVVAARIRAADSLRSSRLGGAVIGVVDDDGAVRGACYVGGTVTPIGGDPLVWTCLADYLATRRRICTSIIGPSAAVGALWPALRRAWGPARLVRRVQPLLVLDGATPVPPDPRVRLARRDDLDAFLPAAAAMYAEEIGSAPFDGVRRPAQVQRLGELIDAGRAMLRLDAAGNVTFKAELAAVTAHTCQVQGVWVRPDLRGRGIGTAATAAVLHHGRLLAPTVSLYVNDFNMVARRMYDRLGMRQVASLTTVLF